MNTNITHKILYSLYVFNDFYSDDLKPFRQTVLNSPRFPKPIENNGSSEVNTIDVLINTKDLKKEDFLSINFLLDIAKDKNIIVRTNILGIAGTYASALAVNGSKNFRTMTENSIHFMPTRRAIGFRPQHQKEQTISCLTSSQISELVYEYKLPLTTLSELFENGELSPMQSLQKKLCDTIILKNGKTMSR